MNVPRASDQAPTSLPLEYHQSARPRASTGLLGRAARPPRCPSPGSPHRPRLPQHTARCEAQPDQACETSLPEAHPERHASPAREPSHARSQMEDLLTGRARGPRRRPPEPHHPRNAALTPAGDRGLDRARFPVPPSPEPSPPTEPPSAPSPETSGRPQFFHREKPGIQHHTGSCDAMQRPLGAVNPLTSRGRTGRHASPPHARRERNHPRAFGGESGNPAGPTKPSTDGAGRHPSVTPGALTPEGGCGARHHRFRRPGTPSARTTRAATASARPLGEARAFFITS